MKTAHKRLSVLWEQPHEAELGPQPEAPLFGGENIDQMFGNVPYKFSPFNRLLPGVMWRKRRAVKAQDPDTGEEWYARDSVAGLRERTIYRTERFMDLNKLSDGTSMRFRFFAEQGGLAVDPTCDLAGVSLEIAAKEFVRAATIVTTYGKETEPYDDE